MSEINDGGAAFPLQGLMLNPENMKADKEKGWVFIDPNTGMTLRDWFAGMALLHTGSQIVGWEGDDIANECYKIANAMLERRKRL